jgi:hypothetical protein
MTHKKQPGKAKKKAKRETSPSPANPTRRDQGVAKTAPTSPASTTIVAPASSAKPSATTKKAFDLPRDSVYVADPIADLRVCGGRGVLCEEEAGDLDTEPGPDVPVRDARRLAQALSESFLANIARDNVRTPIVIGNIDGVATVVEGKSRVRAARRANRQRALLGVPPMRVRCVMQRNVSRLAVMATVISGNNARRDDDLADRIEKLRAYLEGGASELDAATTFNVKQATIRDWLAYDDHATDEVKRAVADNLVGASTAMELAKVKDPDVQRAALAKVLGGAGVKQRSARAARALRRGVEAGDGAGGDGAPVAATDRKSQALLLAYVERGMMVARKFATYRHRAVAPTMDLHDAVSMIREAREHSDTPGDRLAEMGDLEVGYWQGVQEALAIVSSKTVGQASAALLRALSRARAGAADDAALTSATREMEAAQEAGEVTEAPVAEGADGVVIDVGVDDGMSGDGWG